MTIKFHEERILRSYFPKDDEGQSQGMYKPLRSKWIPRATGMWVRAWGVAPISGAEQAIEVSVLGTSPFEGPESGFEFGDLSGNEDLGSVLEGHSVSSGGFINPTATDVWAMSDVSSFSGMETYSGTVVYEFENLGVSYPNLAVRFYPHNWVDGETEILGNPIWAAAKILYRVEH